MFKIRLEGLLKRINDLENESKNVKEKISLNEKILSNHDIAINDILKEMGRLRKRKSSNISGNGVNPEQMTSMIDDLINKLRQEIFKILDDIKQKLGKKIEMEDLWKSEGKFDYFSCKKFFFKE